ncbi:MAG TPA: ABC-F family ATP-binding cassette domain-containing protein [Caulobacteraceae bacterium]|jgi:ATPase subunit of ABC transporter with duplicated ATPase domains|nr:ABC-F family ATP-binding cassette domain-containing protein [Caulobacteraceae bacterium]
MASHQAVLGIEDGGFFHGTRRVFAGVSFLLDAERTALVGENGAGKSTLLSCLAGALELNRGRIVRSRGVRVGLLPQEVPAAYLDLTVREVLERFLRAGGAEGDDWRIDILIDEIGMAAEVAEGSFASLSGGWQRLTLIAGAAQLQAPDILLLDEPTNHLDIGAINTLESWLLESSLPMLIVSHDRAFLERISTRTLFLRTDGVHAFKAPFARAREELLRRDASAAVRQKVEQKEIARLEQVAARYHVWGVKNPEFHKRQKATETRIARLEESRTQVYSPRERRLELAGSELEAKAVARISGLQVRTPDLERRLFAVETLTLAAGDKIALLGPNGAGKSSLLSALAGAYDPLAHYDKDAPIRFNPGCRLAVFDQRMADLPLDRSVMDYVAAAPGVTDREAVRHLAQAGFAFVRLGEPLGVLSFGERARLKFLRLKLDQPNLYLLDEPTSHLDIEGQEALESQLAEQDVACVFVSHDRWFVRAAATRFLEIHGRRLVEVESPDAFFEAQEAG